MEDFIKGVVWKAVEKIIEVIFGVVESITGKIIKGILSVWSEGYIALVMTIYNALPDPNLALGSVILGIPAILEPIIAPARIVGYFIHLSTYIMVLKGILQIEIGLMVVRAWLFIWRLIP